MERTDRSQLFEGLFVHSPIAYALFDERGGCLKSNPAFERMFGGALPAHYELFRDEVLKTQQLLPFFERAYAGDVVETPVFWYDPRQVEHVHLEGERRIAIACTAFPVRSKAGATFLGVAYRDVTPELEAREAFEEEHELLRSIIDQTSDGIIVADGEGTLRVYNPAAARQHGVPPTEVPASEWTSTYGLYSEQGQPLRLAEVPLYRALHGESVRGRVTVRPPGISERVLDYSATPLRRPDGSPAGAVLVTRDQTERIEAELRAQFIGAAGSLLSSSLDPEEVMRNVAKLVVPNLADWCAVDVPEPDGSIRRVTVEHRDPMKVELAWRLEQEYPLRIDSPGAIARVIRTGVPIRVAEVTEEILLASTRGPAHLAAVREAGMRSFLCVPMVARGRNLGALTLIYADDSGRRYTQSELELATELGRRAGLSLDNARLYREAREAIRLRDEFLSIASHELNTPLTPLNLKLESFARNLEKQAPGDPKREQRRADVEVMRRQVRRLSALINGLLDVSRITTGKVVLEPEPLDLAEVVRDVCARLEVEAERAGSRLFVEADTAVTGAWDRLRVEQVVTNLLSNAIKYGAGRPIHVQVQGTTERARLIVRDEGIGVDPAAAERIFERFERAVSERHYGGLGLGLFVTRQIVSAMGGTVRVESEPGAGATFIVELPARTKEGSG